jgi:hypothetical protein
MMSAENIREASRLDWSDYTLEELIELFGSDDFNDAEREDH